MQTSTRKRWMVVLRTLLLLLILWPAGALREAAAQEAIDRTALDEVLQALSAEPLKERIRAVRALGGFKSDRALEALVAACKDEHAMVRRFALRSLSAMGDPRGLSAAKERLADKYSMVRAEAVTAVTVLSSKPEAEWKKIHSTVQDPRAKAMALSSLIDIGPAKVAREIRVAAGRKDVIIRAAAARGLAALGEDEDVERLRTLAGDRQVPVRLAVANACLHMEDPDEALEVISTLLRDKDQGVRWRSIGNLARIDSSEVGSLYLSVLQRERVDSLRVLAAKSIPATNNAFALLKDLRGLFEHERNAKVRQALQNKILAIERAQARGMNPGLPGSVPDSAKLNP